MNLQLPYVRVFLQPSKRKACGFVEPEKEDSFVEHTFVQDTAGSAWDSRHQVMDVSGLQARPSGVLPWQ